MSGLKYLKDQFDCLDILHRYSWSPKEKKKEISLTLVNLLTFLCASMRFTFGFELHVLPATEKVLIKFGNRNGLAFRWSFSSLTDRSKHLRLQATSDHTLFSCFKYFIYLTSRDDLGSPVNLTCTFLFCGRKPDRPQETHTGRGKNMQTQHRTASARGSNQDPSFCEVTVVTTMVAVG